MVDHNHLYVLRKERRLSQDQVARRLNMTQSAYGKLERGQTRLTTDRIYQLAEIFRVDPNEILHPKNGNKVNHSNAGTQVIEIYDLERSLIAIFKNQVETLVLSKYSDIVINYDGIEPPYEELQDFEIKMLKEDYNVNSKEDYNNIDCPRSYYNTKEEEYDAFKKLMNDGDIYYLFKNGLYDFEDNATFDWCWKKYQNENADSLNHRYPANLKLAPQIVKEYLKTISTSNLFMPSKSGIYINHDFNGTEL